MKNKDLLFFEGKVLEENALNAIQMQKEHIKFTYEIKFSAQNKAVLHGRNTSSEEWEQSCYQSMSNYDEANFIIQKGIIPVAWLKIAGLKGKDTAWIAMLVVQETFQHQGIGSFAVRFAEDFAKMRGFTAVGIHTNVDNIIAQSCYKKLGYTIIEENNCTNGDGQKRGGLTFYRDHLDSVRMCIDGVNFHVGEWHDFSFLSKLGKVFKVFDAMDSGNICFGVEREGKRYFVKYAGARTMDYTGEISAAVNRLKNAVIVYEDLQHPNLIRLVHHFSVGEGYAAVFDWVNGEGLRAYWDYAGPAAWNYSESPNYRFRRLPIEKRISAVDKIFDFHRYVAERNYVPVDFYDGSLIYDFETDEIHICDIDFYRKMPAFNNMGRMWGSSRFMAPEEHELGAALDETKAVCNMGMTAFELLCTTSKDSNKVDHAYEAWSGTKAMFDVATKAVSNNRNERYQSIAELIEAWNNAKTSDDIRYKQLSTSDIKPEMLKCFNRYQQIKKSWRKIDEKWVLIDNPHIGDWDSSVKTIIAGEDFNEAIRYDGAIFAAYDADKLIGFTFYDGRPIGSDKQYFCLVMLHLSYEYRNKGIGKKLFQMCAASAKEKGAKKLYISANSSEETQGFYRTMGCTETQEIISDLFEQEPYDVHMEYVLN